MTKAKRHSINNGKAKLENLEDKGMKKRVFVAVLTLMLGATLLMGCSSAPPTQAESVPEPPATSAYPEEGIAEEVVEEQATSDGLEEHTSTGDDIVEGDSMDGPATSDGMGDSIADIAQEIRGIIVLQTDWRESTNNPSFTVNVINPQTGDYHTISSFVFNHVARAREEDFLVEPAYVLSRYSNYRSMFNTDFTLIAATKTFLNDESQHAGWIDQSGTFFDLTVALDEQSQGDFDEAKHYEAVGFTPDDRFVYVDVSDRRNTTCYIVALNNIAPGTSSILTGDDPYLMSSDTWRWARDNYQTCWINDDQFLAMHYSEPIMTCVLATVSSQTVVQIVPTGSQTSWSPVVAPDDISVAFMSAPQNGTENPKIYLTDINGRTQSVLTTSYSPLCGRVAGNGRVLPGISPAYCYTSILEWR